MSVVDLFGSRRVGNAQAYAGDGFAEFWSIYPRHVAKMEAHRAWRRLAPDDRMRAMAALPEHTVYWDEVGRDPERIPHAATWLRGRRFEDELPGSRESSAGREERLRAHAERRG